MKKASTIIIIVCAGGALFMAFACAGGVLLFQKYQSDGDGISKMVDELFRKIDDGAIGTTYLTETTPEFRKIVTSKQYDDIGVLIRTVLGPLKSKTGTNFNWRWMNGTPYVDVIYSGTFEKGTGTIKVKVTKSDGKWLIAGLFVESPAFNKELETAACPKCKALHGAKAKFCPSCGAALTPRLKE